MDFQNFYENQKVLETIFCNYRASIFPRGYVMSHIKCGPDWFTPFDVYWLQTNRLTPKLSIYTFIDMKHLD